MDARDLLRRVRRLELSTRRRVHGGLSGRYRSVFRGRGVSFSDVRPYASGDEVRAIDWNVTARRGELHVKRFTEERELSVVLAVDFSGSTDFGSGPRTKREAAVELAGLVALSAASSGDRVGLLLFTSRVEAYLPPRRGRRHALRVVAEMFRHEPRSAGTDLSAALAFLSRAQRRAASVFLVSDFAQPGSAVGDERAAGAGASAPPAWSRALAAAAARHEIIPVVLTDPAEVEPPRAGPTLLEDPETGAVVRADLSDRRVRAALAAHRAAEAAARDGVFRALGLDALRVDACEPDLAPVLTRFFAERARRSA
jgi:uncharacterized protein (DUF58 family)